MFGKRWQLPIYFQLRWKEIVVPLEDALSSGIGTAKGLYYSWQTIPSLLIRPKLILIGSKDGYALPQTFAVVTAVKACWTSSTYIPELGHRFWRLTLQVSLWCSHSIRLATILADIAMLLQILSRYRTWLEKAVPALYDTSAAVGKSYAAVYAELTADVFCQTTTTTTGTTASARQSVNISRSTTPQPNAHATLPASDPSTDPVSAVAEDNVLRISSMVAFDLIQLRKDIAAFWPIGIAPELEYCLENTDMEQVNGKRKPLRLSSGFSFNLVDSAAILQSLDALKSMFDAPAAQIQQILIRRCTDPLKLVRSVASQLRATAPSPSLKKPEPSHFVSSILKPLREYFAPNGLGEGLDEELSKAWSRTIVSEVIAR